MTRNVRKAAIPAAAAVGAATLLAGAGLASAVDVIPGDNPDTTVVLTGSDALDITVHDVSSGKVTVDVENSGGQALDCAGVGGDPASDPSGLVTAGDVVSQAMDYYAHGPWAPGPFASLTTGLAGNFVPPNMVPDTGSLGSLGSPQVQAQSSVQDAQEQAELAGHSADIPGFTIDAKGGSTDSQSFDITLGTPTNGDRADFAPAAFIVCTGADDGFTYGFAGYNGSTPGGAGGSLGGTGGGSLSSLTGSLGS